MNYQPKLQLLSMFLLICLLTGGCSRLSEPAVINGFYFDTIISVTLYKPLTDNFQQNFYNLCASYENQFSASVSGSDIYRINHAAGQPVNVSDETISLLQLALHYTELTGGKCDPSIYPVSNLWDFHSGKQILPSDAEVAKAITHVDYNCISISGNTVLLTDPEAEIDPGFIAKGYIADRIREFLLQNGYDSGLINLGGNILAFGSRPGSGAYRIGIEYPFHPEKSPILTLQLNDLSVVTSGTYERCFTKDGTLYHHLLDSSTGYPVNNGLSSVTILGPSSADCDALSTSVFLLGREEGLNLIESISDYEAILITTGDEILYSSGAENYVVH